MENYAKIDGKFYITVDYEEWEFEIFIRMIPKAVKLIAVCAGQILSEIFLNASELAENLLEAQSLSFHKDLIRQYRWDVIHLGGK